MTKRTIQIIAVNVVVAGGIVAVAVWQRQTPPRLPASPLQAVNELFDAAQAGDDEAYLALTQGELRQKLIDTRKQVGAEKFRADLKASVAQLKGLALSEPDMPPPEGQAILAELVFPDRSEPQRIELIETDLGWAIVRMAPADVSQPPIRYGTPVYQE